MNQTLIIIGVVAIVLLSIVGRCISISNNINRLRIKVEEGDSGIDVALAKRYDVLTKMIEVVKGYTKHEKETLIEVTKLREHMTLEEKKEANLSMNKGFDKVNAVVENYPDLKASENFKTLQKAVVDVEEHLQAARRLYNSNVSAYNQYIETFPNSIIANMKGSKSKGFFEADEKMKDNVVIDSKEI